MPSLIGIAASTKDGVIGMNGAIPWHYKEDLAFFKFMTTGHTVIMGGKTYRNIGKSLPNRENVIISQCGVETKENNVEIVNIGDRFPIKVIEKYLFKNEDIYVIGGGKIYEMFFDHIDRWIITYVDDQIELKSMDFVTRLDVDTICKTFKKLAEIKLSDKCKVVKYDRIFR